MPMTDYEILKLEAGYATGKIENHETKPQADFEKSPNTVGTIDTEDYRLTVTPSNRLRDDGPGRFKTQIKVQVAPAQRGKKGGGGKVSIPGLTVRFSINGTKVGSDEDISGGERQHDLPGLQIGMNRVEVELVGHFSLITDMSISNVAKPIPIKLTIEPGGLEEISRDMLKSDVAIRFTNTDLSKLMLTPDLKVILKVNNQDVSGEQDLSTGQLNYTLTNLAPGYSRITAELVGRGLTASGVIQFARKVVASVLPTKTDSYATGVGTIWTQVTPEKANIAVTYTRDDSSWTQTEITDVRGMAVCNGVTVTRPTHFTIVCPVANIADPERLCIVPPAVGIPSWAKRCLKLCTISLAIVIALLIFMAYISPEVQEIVSDPVIARSLRAKGGYAVVKSKEISAAQASIPLINNILWKCFWICFIAKVLASIACMWKATRAGYRNWRFRSSENRLGRSATTQTSGTPSPSASATQTPTERLMATSNPFYKQIGAIVREIIAEAFVDAAARGVRSFKIL